MATRICVIGYYDHHNVGDEQYRVTISRIFKDYFPRNKPYRLDFIDCDKIHNQKFSDTDVILLGGGDVLNNYFLDKVIAKFTGCKNKIIAVSVGLPYPKVLTDTGKLSIIDYIFIRTQQDMDLFAKYFHPHRIMYLPDLSYVLALHTPSATGRFEHQQLVSCNPQVYPITSDVISDTILTIKSAKSLGKQIVCLSLNRHVYREPYFREYNNIITNLAYFVKYLLNFNNHVILLPSNTNMSSSSENDILMQNDLLKAIGVSNVNNVTAIERELSAEQILQILEHVDICVPMRFHMCLFSIYKKVPIFPIFTTRKIRNLLLDINWHYGYELDKNTADIPIYLDLNTLLTRFAVMQNSVRNRTWLRSKLRLVNLELFNEHFIRGVGKLMEVIVSDYSKIGSSLQTRALQQTKIDQKVLDVYNSLQDFIASKGFSDFREVRDEHLQDILVYIVSYHLTGGSINSIYNYGLKSKMFCKDEDGHSTYNFTEEWKWILNHQETQRRDTIKNNPNGLFNIRYIDQIDYSGSHRSGWQYVYDSIATLHSDTAPLLLDLYVDRTFHWNSEINKILGIIPYTKWWMGFVHHTFDTSFSTFNCHTLLDNPEFISSLDYCRGLIVLSEYLKRQFEEQLKKRNLRVPIYVLTHPTETDVPKFSFANFVKNNDKKIIHVGGWLRNVYAFYNLTVPNNTKIKYGFLFGDKTKTPIAHLTTTIRKVALRGKNMNNYFPHPNFTERLHSMLINSIPTANSLIPVLKNISQNCSSNCSSELGTNEKSQIKNNWYRHFYNDTIELIKSVDFIEHLENSEYDTLLTRNIVFIYLVDASAVNTVIECMIRNTPIIINRHPAVVELLGENYPLYVENNTLQINTTVNTYLSEPIFIRRAHTYLKRLDKRKLHIHTFMKELVRILN